MREPIQYYGGKSYYSRYFYPEPISEKILLYSFSKQSSKQRAVK